MNIINQLFPTIFFKKSYLTQISALVVDLGKYNKSKQITIYDRSGEHNTKIIMADAVL